MKSCKAMNMPTSTFYYKGKKNKMKDAKVLQKIEKFCELVPEAGYRPVTAHLKKTMTINKKRVARIMKENGLLCNKKRSFKSITTYSNHSYRKYPNLTVDFTPSDLNQLIVGDITAFDIRGKDHYLALLMDVFNREIVGFAVSSKNNTALALAALTLASQRRGNLQDCIHHTDSDVRYCSKLYVSAMNKLGLKISMCKGNAYENAFAESLNATMKRQEVNVNEYTSLTQATKSITGFIKIYNEIRPHSSLNGMSPKEKEELKIA